MSDASAAQAPVWIKSYPANVDWYAHIPAVPLYKLPLPSTPTTSARRSSAKI
jgi:hypothetical protein